MQVATAPALAHDPCSEKKQHFTNDKVLREKAFSIWKLILLFSGSCGVYFMVVPALAEQKIGVAASVEKDVTGSVSGRITRLKTGDEVYGGEVIVTVAESRAQIKFQDGSDLQIGPVSHINLDSRVYSSASGAGSVVVNTTKGVFRFISAPGGHAPYQVHTPMATIGLRGTTFSVRVQTGSTDAVVEEGAIEVCTASGADCKTLNQACTFVTVSSQGVTTPKEVGPKDWSFNNSCGGGGGGGKGGGGGFGGSGSGGGRSVPLQVSPN
jgi:uncharacterized membrane protein YgcG